jgi:hypothetical protein
MKRILLAAALLATPRLGTAQLSSGVPAEDPTKNRHLGFFLRLDAGVGFLNSSTMQRGVNASMYGVGIPIGIAVGGSVSENFILAGDLWGAAGVTPTFKLGSQTTAQGSSSFALGGLGLNLTYYFMPANVYISVTPSMATLTLNASGQSSSSQIGFGCKVGVGKEWWVGDHWGLGLAGQFLLGINQDTGTNPPTWTTVGGALAFSATFN